MRVHSLLISAFVMFVAGSLLTALFPFDAAAAGSGQGHPAVEICDSNLCVKQTAGGAPRIGIGNTDPIGLLEIRHNGGEFVLISPATGGQVPLLHFRNDNTGAEWFFRQDATGTFSVLTGNTNPGSEVLTLDNNKRIGIGTTTPQAPLDVVGTALFEGPVRMSLYTPSNTTIYSAFVERTVGGSGCKYSSRVKVFTLPGAGRFKVTFDLYEGDTNDYVYGRLLCDGVPCTDDSGPDPNGVPATAKGGWKLLSYNRRWSYHPVSIETTSNLTNVSFLSTNELALDIFINDYHYQGNNCQDSNGDKIKNAHLKGTLIKPTGTPGVLVD